MHCIAILNEKGGVGKSTISINIASYLSKQKKRVLLIDTDYLQGSASDWATVRENINFPVVTVKPQLVKSTVDNMSENYDYIIIDGKPGMGRSTGQVICAVDYVLIPIQPSPPDVWAVRTIVDVIGARRDIARGSPLCSFVISRANRTNDVLIKETKEALEEYFPPVLEGMTTQFKAYKNTFGEGVSIFEDSSPEGKVAQKQIQSIVQEIQEELDNENTYF